MKSEKLLELIKQAKIEIINEHDFGQLNDDLNLNRELKFKINDKEFSILWFKNLMTLKTECGLEVMFKHIVHSSTWPNRYKRNLQFYIDCDCVAVIGLELYPYLDNQDKASIKQ